MHSDVPSDFQAGILFNLDANADCSILATKYSVHSLLCDHSTHTMKRWCMRLLLWSITSTDTETHVIKGIYRGS